MHIKKTREENQIQSLTEQKSGFICHIVVLGQYSNPPRLTLTNLKRSEGMSPMPYKPLNQPMLCKEYTALDIG